MATLRIAFVGDSITVGSGDAGFLGWPGRACIAETGRGHDVTLYNAGVRGDTSETIRARWQAECRVRLPDHVNGALVFSFGTNDAAAEAGAGARVPHAASVANARAILAPARDWLPALMLGPIPTVDAMQPYVFPNGVAYHFSNDRTAALSAAYGELCGELGIPYLDLFAALRADAAWARAQRACDGVHATGDGYALVADRLTRWPAWRAWFDG
jgi:lysophospholipase L1-like esterase